MMNPSDITNRQPENRFTSGESLTEKEFKQGIKKAEKSSFFTVQESMNRFEEWLRVREKK
jgi:hypothetical protein